MQAVLTEAKAMLENKSATTQKEIDDMVTRLATAIGELVVVDELIFKDEDSKISFNASEHENLADIKVKGDLFIADIHQDGMTIGKFIEVMKQNMTDGLDIECYDGTTKITDMNRLVFTGAIFKIMKGTEVVDTFTAAVLGDLDGDGRSTAKDSFLMKLHAAEGTELDDHFFAAIDQNDDGVYNAKDSFLTAYKAANWETYRTTATAES